MNKLFKSLFLICLLFSLVFITTNAQEETDEPKIETKYNDSKNETEVELRQVPISVDKSKIALLSISASFKGKKISKPADVFFIVSVVSVGNYKYPQINNVTLNSDGKSLGEIIMLNLDQREFSETEVLETLGTRMKFDIFKKFVVAKKVSFQIGESLFHVNETQLTLFNELEKIINP